MPEIRDTTHPVWDVYDLYRTAKLKVCYYSIKLRRYLWMNYCLEICLALTASSSAVAALWFWNTPTGQVIWRGLLIVSAFLAVIKPVIKLTEKIRKYEEVLSGYRILENDLMKITVMIKQSMNYEILHRSKLFEAIDRHGELVQKSPELQTNDKLLAECQNRVKTELPAEKFFIPKG